MSPSNVSWSTTEFSIRALDARVGSQDNETQIKIFNGHGQLCDEGQGKLTVELPRGLYTVRVERLGEMLEEVVVHTDGTNKDIDVPYRNSAMPMSDTKHTHEFLQGAAQQYSTNSTFEQHPAEDNWPRMMIMVRGSGEAPNSVIDDLSNLCLYDEYGQVVTDFRPSETMPDQPDLFLVYSEQLEPGNYILARTRKDRVHMLPIILYAGWDSFVFVPYEKGIRLSSSSIKMTKHNSGYNPDDPLSASLDAALQGLGSRLDLLPSSIRRSALDGKFSHPLVGLIGGYSHFMGEDRKEKLEQQVLKNLWRLLPGSPDVIALLLMSLDRDRGDMPKSKKEFMQAAKAAFGEKIDKYLPLKFPPMLNSGLQAILRTTQDFPTIVADGSWLETAGNSSFGSGVWALWDQRIADKSAPIVKNARPSTQRLYPLVKQALSEASEHPKNEILAKTVINDLFGDRTMFGGADKGFGFNIDKDYEPMIIPYEEVESKKTVRDLVKHVQDVAKPAASNMDFMEQTEQHIRPQMNVSDWLIDAVHDGLEQDGKEFDPGALAKRYAVSLRVVELATQLPRPSIDVN